MPLTLSGNGTISDLASAPTVGGTAVQFGEITAADLSSTLDLTGKTVTLSGEATGPTVSSDLTLSGNGTVTVTGIPPWAKRITVLTYNASNQGGVVDLRVGTSSGLVTSGYSVVGAYADNQSTVRIPNTVSTSFSFTDWTSAGNGYYRRYVLEQSANQIWNLWAHNHIAGISGYWSVMLGYVNAAGTVDRVALLCTTGNFDDGSMRVMYE
jgi:hypothetical protein